MNIESLLREAWDLFLDPKSDFQMAECALTAIIHLENHRRGTHDTSPNDRCDACAVLRQEEK